MLGFAVARPWAPPEAIAVCKKSPDMPPQNLVMVRPGAAVYTGYNLR